MAVMVNGLSGLAGGVIKGAYWARNNAMARRALIGAGGGLAANIVVNTANGRNPFRGARNSMIGGGILGAGYHGAIRSGLTRAPYKGLSGLGDLSRFAKASIGEVPI